MSTLLDDSFQKIFLGTQITGAGAGQNPNTNLTNGFITVAGIGTELLNNTSVTPTSNYGLGAFGFFDPKTFKSVAIPGRCCPLVLASASVFANDMIGPFHGGYKETVKSKIINPKSVFKMFRVNPCTSQQAVVHIGRTKYTNSLSPLNAACNFEFRCGETYSLRIDLNNSPALRFLNHNIYRTIDAYTGCCPDGAPTNTVDSTLVMITWANSIISDPILSNYISPIVYTEAGVPLAANTAAAVAAGLSPTAIWTTYVSLGHVVGATAGLRMLGAYVDTKFGNCSFVPTDFFEKAPVQITASLVDFNGDPCAFTGICVVTECEGRQGEGFGETVVRDLILSESYRQNRYNTNDVRIREITQGDQIVSALNRNTQYYRYIIQHAIPRTLNPTGIYDADRYQLEIITSAVNPALETYLNTWVADCNGPCTALEIIGCNSCTVLTP